MDILHRILARKAEEIAERCAPLPLAELAARRAEQDAKGWQPAEPRKRQVSTALKVYAQFAASADKGAVRVLPE